MPLQLSWMERYFKPYLDQFVVIFIDDILTSSESREDHKGRLRRALATLREHKLNAKLSKCDFSPEEVKFLGHEVSREGSQSRQEFQENTMQLHFFGILTHHLPKSLPSKSQ